MGVGARSMAMGGGSAGLADDANAAYYNPAGLVFIDNRQVGLTLHSMALDRRLMYAGYAQSFGTRPEPGRKGRPMQAGFSLAWLGAGTDRIDGRDSDGNHTDTYSNFENAFFFSFALKPGPALAVGFSGKLVWNTFPRMADRGKAMSASGFGFDLGVMAKPLPFLRLGAKYTWDSQKMYERGTQTRDKFPETVCAGAAWQAASGRLLVTGQVEKVRAFPARLSGGVQFSPFEGIFLRAGLRGTEPGFGAGLRRQVVSGKSQVDYAYVPDPVAPRGNHVFTWSFLF
jgi:hypothetical protein